MAEGGLAGGMKRGPGTCQGVDVERVGEMFPSEEGGCSQHASSPPWGRVRTGHSGLTASHPPFLIPHDFAWSAALTRDARFLRSGFLEPSPNTHRWESGEVQPSLTPARVRAGLLPGSPQL